MKSEEMISMDQMTNSEEMIELRKRNEERTRQFIESMGEKWVLHPSNAPKKINHVRVLQK